MLMMRAPKHKFLLAKVELVNVFSYIYGVYSKENCNFAKNIIKTHFRKHLINYERNQMPTLS